VLHCILSGSLSFHPLKRAHVNTMTHLLLSDYSTHSSVDVSGIRSGVCRQCSRESQIFGRTFKNIVISVVSLNGPFPH